MKHDPATIIRAALEAGVAIDAPVVAIEAQEESGTYVLVLYNGKRLDWHPRQDAAAEGDVSPPSKPSARRRGKT